MAYIDITGMKFSRLTAVAVSHEKMGDKLKYWHCVCDCGKKVVVSGAALRKGNTRSCGCLQKEKAAANGRAILTRHGKTKTKEYQAWRSMLKRCLLPSDKNYKNYGGRGVSVCESWKQFENFFCDMGVSPEGTSLDRIDVNGNYEPSNCRWADTSTQCNNKQKSVFIEHDGRKLTIAEWEGVLNVSRQTMYYRFRKGWIPSEVLFGKASAV